MAVFQAVLKPGDTFLGMNLDHGGHLSHGSPVNFSGMMFNAPGNTAESSNDDILRISPFLVALPQGLSKSLPMRINLDHGGHLSHGSPVNFSGMMFNALGYNVDENTGYVDYDEMERIALEHRGEFRSLITRYKMIFNVCFFS